MISVRWNDASVPNLQFDACQREYHPQKKALQAPIYKFPS